MWDWRAAGRAGSFRPKGYVGSDQNTLEGIAMMFVRSLGVKVREESRLKFTCGSATDMPSLVVHTRPCHP